MNVHLKNFFEGKKFMSKLFPSKLEVLIVSDWYQNGLTAHKGDQES